MLSLADSDLPAWPRRARAIATLVTLIGVSPCLWGDALLLAQMLQKQLLPASIAVAGLHLVLLVSCLLLLFSFWFSLVEVRSGLHSHTATNHHASIEV